MIMNGYESVGLIPLSSYFDRSDVLGGMHPDQTCTSATQGVIIQADPRPSLFQTHIALMMQKNILWTYHEHDNECL